MSFRRLEVQLPNTSTHLNAKIVSIKRQYAAACEEADQIKLEMKDAQDEMEDIPINPKGDLMQKKLMDLENIKLKMEEKADRVDVLAGQLRDVEKIRAGVDEAFQKKIDQVLSVLDPFHKSEAPSGSRIRGESLVQIRADNCTIFMLNCTPSRCDDLLTLLQESCVDGPTDRSDCWLGTRLGIVTVLDVGIAKPKPVLIKPKVTGALSNAQALREQTSASASDIELSTIDDTSTPQTAAGGAVPPLARVSARKKSHLPWEEIHDAVQGATDMSETFWVMLICAAVIAALGLATNSAVMVVASMLISPLMGPILSFTYGATILSNKNQRTLEEGKKMVIKGIKNELIAGLVTFICGLVLGLLLVALPVHFPRDNFWPTDEMTGRGRRDNLITGLIFAIASGFVVGHAVTGGGINSLVGVAISASLLPPVVNAGMLLALASIGPHIYDTTDESVYNRPRDLPYVINPDQLMSMAGTSIGLYLMNLLVIFVVCFGVFKYKGLIFRSVTAKGYWEGLPRVPTLAPGTAMVDAYLDQWDQAPLDATAPDAETSDEKKCIVM
eukprot:GFYU01010482.1.p1 GENE.GFYU01010482.1~~GFYU01010482.1.p1  ORF type:complete len:556 (-),score=97.99 GFYU01010482.1:136-1803(-)